MRLESLHWPGLHAVVLTAGVMSCRPTTPPQVAPAPASEPAASAAYEGPAVSIGSRRVDGPTEMTVGVTFPTGGWELRSDETKVVDGVGVAYLTFEGPGPNEMVTQALDEKQWPWRSTEPLSRAEVWVNVVRRGDSPREPDYRLAARFPSETK